MRCFSLLVYLIGICLFVPDPALTAGRGDFVEVREVAPDILVEARYFGGKNFMGRPILGYKADICLLTKPAAQQLAEVQKELRKFGLGLKVYDCYRPQQAVDHFVSWAKDLSDQKMKKLYYPDVDKSKLFKEGYIAEKSGHSRGSTLDVTLVFRTPEVPHIRPEPSSCKDPKVYRYHEPMGLGMGTAWDCFDPLSHTANGLIHAEARRNRLLLKSIMEMHGFENYDKEWWHYTLKDEPFPKTYFDFPVSR